MTRFEATIGRWVIRDLWNSWETPQVEERKLGKYKEVIPHNIKRSQVPPSLYFFPSSYFATAKCTLVSCNKT